MQGLMQPFSYMHRLDAELDATIQIHSYMHRLDAEFVANIQLYA